MLNRRGLRFLALGAFCLEACHEPTAPDRSLPAVADTVFGAGATLWFVVDTLGGGLARGTVDQDRVYFGRGDFKLAGELIARDRSTGALRWHQPFNIAWNTALAGNGVAAASGSLGIFDRATGALVRQYVPPNDVSVSGNVASDGSHFFVGTYYSQVAAIDPSLGRELWRTPLASNTGTHASGIAVAGDRVAVTATYSPPIGVTTDSGIVAVLDAATGAVLWRISVAGSTAVRSAAIVDPPAIAGSVVVTRSLMHQVHAYDLSSGHELWSYDATRSAFDDASDGIAACDGAIIISDGNMGLVSLDAANGAERWRLPDLQIGSLFWIDCSYGTIMTMSAGLLKIFNSQTGALLRRIPPDEHSDIFVSSATRDADAVYVASDRGFGAIRVP
jgi:outer membrane protein assembly factor BamB